MVAILPEEMVVKRIEKELKVNDIWYMKTHGDAFGKSGIPDIVCCINGNFVSFEVKRHKGGVQSELQKYNQKRIIASGGQCEFINDPEIAIDIINKNIKGEI